MKKLRVSPALLALCAAVLLFVGAFFLGRASALGEARITVQRAAHASEALQIDGSGEGKLCLNTATREELLALPGVGEKTADRILSYRDTYGRFSAVEPLLDGEGLGPTLLDAIWGYDVSSEIRTVDVHIRRLREKLELNPAQPEHILTKWGVGYYFKY